MIRPWNLRLVTTCINPKTSKTKCSFLWMSGWNAEWSIHSIAWYSLLSLSGWYFDMSKAHRHRVNSLLQWFPQFLRNRKLYYFSLGAWNFLQYRLRLFFFCVRLSAWRFKIKSVASKIYDINSYWSTQRDKIVNALKWWRLTRYRWRAYQITLRSTFIVLLLWQKNALFQMRTIFE